MSDRHSFSACARKSVALAIVDRYEVLEFGWKAGSEASGAQVQRLLEAYVLQQVTKLPTGVARRVASRLRRTLRAEVQQMHRRLRLCMTADYYPSLDRPVSPLVTANGDPLQAESSDSSCRDLSAGLSGFGTV